MNLNFRTTKPTLTLLTALLLVSLSFPGFAAASAPSGQISEPITLLTFCDAEWYGSTFWTGPDWTRVGKNWHHPGQNTARGPDNPLPKASEGLKPAPGLDDSLDVTTTKRTKGNRSSQLQETKDWTKP